MHWNPSLIVDDALTGILLISIEISDEIELSFKSLILPLDVVLNKKYSLARTHVSLHQHWNEGVTF